MEINKSNRITSSTAFLLIGAMMMAYGFIGIDFSFGASRWDEEQKVDFPLVGRVPAEAAFQYSALLLLGGIVTIMISIHLAVINYSTVRYIAVIIGGAMLIAWGVWGVSFSFNTAENRITHGIDRVEIPCLDFCFFDSFSWLIMNIVMIIVGFVLIFAGIGQSRYYTKHSYQI